ncbi:MAG: bifunctional [glutamate--ammonia ligase]-adenylyl-L-tyrosine phosphorylase/[glutamate--ammonia-ligase] adenylyltransferase [Nitrospinae bacterium]|nr:bifunctional [glutamate--ammonia ligase]-adenylyl-L-tyrosine phosphorylase/[glutamate--ammonia-ligase] adenylyltransferase [Nitrospinota bacterium]
MTPEEIVLSSADPDTVASGFNRLFETRPQLASFPEIFTPLAGLFAGSDYLTNYILARPNDLDWLTTGEILLSSRGKESMQGHIEMLLTAMEPMPALRRFKHRELARIAARELAGLCEVTEALAEWSTVADIAIDTAITIAETKFLKLHGQPFYTPFEGKEELPARFACLGMGKLGGEELNISSDVDLIYVHSSNNGSTTGKEDGSAITPLHQHFVMVAREVTRLLGESTEDGSVFRVDLDLRPEGTRGEITNSIGAMEVYYESWGQQWERQALLKARVCGGSKQVGDETLRRLYPFMYRKYLDQRAIDEIAAMKGKIDLQLQSKKGVRNAERNIKLGHGGIREIEFVTQAMQLLYAARYPELRTQNTLKALDACRTLGLLSAPHHRDLRESYLFYRRLENRIQYHQLLQTHSMPEYPERLKVLGKLMGFDSEDPAATLLEETKKRQKRVRNIFDLFFKKEEEKKAADSFPAPTDDVETITAWLDSLSFDKPEESARALNTLRNGKPFTHPSERSRLAFDRFGPEIIREAQATPWPDHVLVGFERFVEARGGRDMLYELLDETRPIIKLLSAIFSQSERLTATLIRQPDVLDRMLVADPLERPADRFRYRGEFRSALDGGGTAENKMSSLNMFRSAESLRLGLRRLLGLSDRFELMEGLTKLAEEFLKASFSLAAFETGCGEKGWAVLAAGKLGRREMNYGSDMDLIVFVDDREMDRAGVTLLTQHAIRLCGAYTPYGSGYALDMRLRPYGEKGELVPSINAAEEYYGGKADAWERLALVGARPIAGDEAVGAMVMETMDRFITHPPLTPQESARIAEIRERIADEKVRTGAVDIKFGRGGLIEIEFILQWLALEEPSLGSPPEKEEPFTMSTLARARARKIISAQDTVELEKAYVLYRSLEDALRMDREQALNVIPLDVAALRRLARMVALPGVGPERLLGEVKETMAKVRAVYLDFVSQRAQ